MERKNDEKQFILQSSDELKGRNAAKTEFGRFSRLLPFLLAAVVILLVCLTYAMNAQKKTEPVQTTADAGISLIEVSAEQLQRVAIAQARAPAYAIERKGAAEEDDETTIDDFMISGEPDFSVDAKKIRQILTNCIQLSADRAVEYSGNAAEYGLDAPAVTVDIDYADGSSKQLRIGDQTPTENEYYLQMADDDHVFLVSANLFRTFNCPLNDLHNTELPVQISADDFENMIIEREGEETIELRMTTKLQQAVSSIELVQPIQYDAHPSRAGSIIEDFCTLQIAGYAGHADGAEDLKEYGLDHPRMRFVFTEKDGTQLECRIGADIGAMSYAALDDTGDVYLIDNTAYDFINNVRVSYLIDQFVNLVNMKSVTGLSITGEGVNYTLSIERPEEETEGDATEESVCSLNGVPIPESAFKTLYQSAVGLVCDGMTDDRHMEGEASLCVAYHLNNGEELVVEYVNYDDENYVVRRNGVTLLTIQKNKVRAMLDAFAKIPEED